MGRKPWPSTRLWKKWQSLLSVSPTSSSCPLENFYTSKMSLRFPDTDFLKPLFHGLNKWLTEWHKEREFPDGPVVRTWWFHCCGPGGSIPDQGTKIPQGVHCGKKKKRNISRKKTSLVNLGHYFMFILPLYIK